MPFFYCVCFCCVSSANKPYCLWASLKSIIDCFPFIPFIIFDHSISWEMMVSGKCMAVVDYHFYLLKPTCSVFSTIKDSAMRDVMQCYWSLENLFQFCHILHLCTRLAHSFFLCINFLFAYTS